MQGDVGARTYGPLLLKPQCGLNPTGENGQACFGNLAYVGLVILYS